MHVKHGHYKINNNPQTNGSRKENIKKNILPNL
jgi:hypothetical protein